MRLDRFDPTTIQSDSVCVFSGSRRSGKTVAMTTVLGVLRKHYPEAVVISDTESVNRHWGNYVPSQFIREQYDGSFIRELIRVQKKRIDANGGVKDHTNSIPIILDDMAFDKNIKSCEQMARLMTNGRHVNAGVFRAVQFSYNIQTNLRDQVEFLFCFFTDNNVELKKLHETFFACFESFKEFKRVFRHYTSQGEGSCLVLNKTVKSTDISKKVFYWRPSFPIKPFRMCRSRYWKKRARSENGCAEDVPKKFRIKL